MKNEDFNEVADQLGRDVATNRNERLLYQSLIEEIRGLWDALSDLGWEPPEPPEECEKDGCESVDEAYEEDECQKPKTPPKATKKKTTKKKGVTKA